MTRTISARTRRFPLLRIVGLVVLALVALGVPSASALRSAPAVPAPPANPTNSNQIQNIDQVRTAIKGYYGDTTSSVPDPVNGATMLHFASPGSAYAKEMAGIERTALAYLGHPSKNGKGHGARGEHAPGTKAILLDVDDTTLNTYDYEIYSNFAYNPTTNAAFVNSAAFPAVFGMPDLVKQAQAEGYTVFFLTGRPESQRTGTVENLTNTGYDVVSDQLYLRNREHPPTWLSSCAPTCTTIQYKSLTRQHIEKAGYDIVANFGDQYSDLTGGFADRTYKLPNPMYYLP